MPDLGKTYDGGNVPADPISHSMIEQEVHYPSLYVEGLSEPLGLPAEGEATITFKIRQETKKIRNGKTTYCYDLDVKSIYPKKGGKGKAKSKDTSEALDELLAKVMSEKDDD